VAEERSFSKPLYLFCGLLVSFPNLIICEPNSFSRLASSSFTNTLWKVTLCHSISNHPFIVYAGPPESALYSLSFVFFLTIIAQDFAKCAFSEPPGDVVFTDSQIITGFAVIFALCWMGLIQKVHVCASDISWYKEHNLRNATWVKGS
jgi:hypothetical protein